MIAESDSIKFTDRSAWRSWLDRHHAAKPKVWLVIQKKSSKLEGIFLDEAIEEALCYGWIDGKLNPRDDQSYFLRFSPRKPDSIWSVSNIRRVENLTREGKMTESGITTVRIAKENGQWQAAFDRERTDEIPPELETALRRRKGAIAAYRELPPSKKKQCIYWLQSAKRNDTKRKRIEEIVNQVLGEE